MLTKPEPSDQNDAAARLRAFIVEGGYEPGDRLPPERELTGALAMGRSMLRRALDQLERDGAIWRHVGKGTFVANGIAAAGGAGGLVELGRQLTPFRMMRARRCIEPAIAREAAMNASGESMTRMRLAMERARSASNWEDYEAQDDHFHRTIAMGADNLLLLSLFDQLNQVRRAVAWGNVTRDTIRPDADHQSFGEHEAIATAIEARDPDRAYEAMRLHLGSVNARLFDEG
ncbi:FadR/GntR family transcriptional regulator [Paracoccus saliphilus]|uniref:FadR family transcriptional regulator n=1 Tax=Paracoccus saliphilus TaxID=405559 RepID=A0AA45W550_9RHOB|nr:FCD domain-containing protein [Paracoccus saliphilus]WCR02132.1 FadR family transcriptional regulator [Paracoccus saliphilus]SIS90348.1 transcriptional regulator, GntR family [Paracoccus saliphilus]